MNRRSGRSSPSIWAIAVGLTLLLHVLTMLGLIILRPFAPRPVAAQDTPAPISFVFAAPPAPAPTEDETEPDFFSELPEDRADIAPERADAISNVDSRARDRAEGETTSSLPELRGESEAPHVRMDPGGPSLAGEGTDLANQDEGSQADIESSPANPSSEAPSGEDEQRSSELGGEDPARSLEELGEAGEDARNRDDGAAGSGAGARLPGSRDPRRDMVLRRQAAGAVELLQRPSGLQDIFQEEMSNPGGNAVLFGDLTLNTVEWPYAGWLKRFRRDFIRNWRAPYAYYLGVIDGWTLVEIEVAPDGRLLRLDRLDASGHESLGQASVGAFTSMAPFLPLPDNFPEESLILRIKLVYPPRR